MSKGIRNSKLSPVASEEDILEAIKKGIVARDALDALNIKLQGKLTRGVTQAGRRIKETSVQVPSKDMDILRDIAQLEAESRILRFVRNLQEVKVDPNDPLKRIQELDYEDFDMIDDDSD